MTCTPSPSESWYSSVSSVSASRISSSGLGDESTRRRRFSPRATPLPLSTFRIGFSTSNSDSRPASTNAATDLPLPFGYPDVRLVFWDERARALRAALDARGRSTQSKRRTRGLGRGREEGSAGCLAVGAGSSSAGTGVRGEVRGSLGGMGSSRRVGSVGSGIDAAWGETGLLDDGLGSSGNVIHSSCRRAASGGGGVGSSRSIIGSEDREVGSSSTKIGSRDGKTGASGTTGGGTGSSDCEDDARGSSGCGFGSPDAITGTFWGKIFASGGNLGTSSASSNKTGFPNKTGPVGAKLDSVSDSRST